MHEHRDRVVQMARNIYSDPSPRRSDVEFDHLWRRYRPQVWRLIARLAGSIDRADDLTQETGVQALQGYAGFRGKAADFTWLYRIAVHVVYRDWRRRKQNEVPLDTQQGQESASGAVSSDLPPAYSSPEAALQQKELHAAVRQALDRLPEDLRTILILRVYQDLKYREIARILQIPEGTVMSRLHSARQQLKKELEDHEL